MLTTTEIKLFRNIGGGRPLADIGFDSIQKITFDCNQMMMKLHIQLFSGENSRYLFLICENSRDFKKWMTMIPLVFKKINIKVVINGDPSEIGLYKGDKKKSLPLDVKKLERLQDNADFVISDEEEGKIELYRRVNDRFNTLNEIFDNF